MRRFLISLIIGVCFGLRQRHLPKSKILVDGGSSFLYGNGRGDNHVNLELVGKFVNLLKEGLESCNVVVSDLKCGIYEEIGYVVVAGKNTCYKSVKSLCIEDEIIVCIDKTGGILNVEAKSYSLFDTTASFTMEMSVLVLPVPLTPIINLSINVLLCRRFAALYIFHFLRKYLP